LLTLPACEAPEVEEDTESALAGDADGDGILDTTEAALAAKFSPRVKLAPTANDPYRPASVDWYLPKVHMRFSHTDCPDHQVVAEGSATQANLSTQTHPTDNIICVHTSTIYASSASHGEFFLQPSNTGYHTGAPSSEWRTYVHVKKSTLVSGGFDIQYWFFYAYDDGPLNFNHEADWEHITVTADANQNFYSVWYAQHNSGTRYTKAQVSWVNSTHPVVYSAAGTHASYPAAGSYDVLAFGFTDYTYDTGTAYDTGSNLINVGEVKAPLNGQSFIKYGGRWGEIGLTSYSTGPQTPSVQPTWNTY
jgi:hypothetical protein